MNTQEREQLTRFLQQLAQAQVGAKDVDAERLIHETCSRQPDSNYLLVQRCLLLDQALATAQSEITRLQQTQQNTPNNTSFLNNSAWGNTPTPAPAQQTQQPSSFSAPPQTPAIQPATPGWGSGMLGTVATTAAGVVAGSFLYQGINNMMGHHNSNAAALADKTPAPSHHAEPEQLVSNTYPENTAPPVDFDSLGPSDEDAGWA